MDTTLAEQIIGALIGAPANIATQAFQRLEADDFADWQHRTIYGALTKCEFADHCEAGSLIVQINSHLLTDGHFKDVDNGLRLAVADLTGVVGHPEQLNNFITELIDKRFRREVADYALAIADHSQRSPLEDVDKSLAGIAELRRLRSRIHTPPKLMAVNKEEGAA